MAKPISSKKREELAKMGLMNTPKKIRKARKPMTEEQRAAAVERLAKARAARPPAKNPSIDEGVRNIPDEETFSLKNVKEWLDFQKDELQAIKHLKNSKDSKEVSRWANTKSYITNLETYLRTGIYNDLFYGKTANQKVNYVTVAMAYYADGTPKRSVGNWYPDIGLYTQEMADDNDWNRIFKQS